MTKKPEYEPIAAQYFVEMQMTVSQIAKRLDVSEKTIHNWKKAGGWEEKDPGEGGEAGKGDERG